MGRSSPVCPLMLCSADQGRNWVARRLELWELRSRSLNGTRPASLPGSEACASPSGGVGAADISSSNGLPECRGFCTVTPNCFLELFDKLIFFLYNAVTLGWGNRIDPLLWLVTKTARERYPLVPLPQGDCMG